jgi:hypothetical protein
MTTPRRKLLFICGSINQTTQMHQIARELEDEYRCIFTPYYGNLDFDFLKRIGALEYTIGGHKLGGRCLEYLYDHGLEVDVGNRNHRDTELVLWCSDLVRPKNIRDKKVILVQEGMSDPESVLFPVVRRFRWLPGWLGGTSATGLSDLYDRFCVASEGFRDLYVKRGVKAEKIVVTGIPNFDDAAQYLDNDFPHKGYVLCCTSDVREVFWYEDRRGFIEKARRLAEHHNKPLIFKLHPNEKLPRAIDEIRRWAPGARVYTEGRAEEMVANCDVLVCKYSSVAFVGLALGKEVHSLFPEEDLKRWLPLQNRAGARNIANVARELLGDAIPAQKRSDSTRHAAAARESRPGAEAGAEGCLA